MAIQAIRRPLRLLVASSTSSRGSPSSAPRRRRPSLWRLSRGSHAAVHALMQRSSSRASSERDDSSRLPSRDTAAHACSQSDCFETLNRALRALKGCCRKNSLFEPFRNLEQVSALFLRDVTIRAWHPHLALDAVILCWRVFVAPNESSHQVNSVKIVAACPYVARRSTALTSRPAQTAAASPYAGTPVDS